MVSTSRGNPAEDLIIERAIRASIQELQTAKDSAITDQQALDLAIQASIAEANSGSEGPKVDEEHLAAIEDAIQRSLYHTDMASTVGATSQLEHAAVVPQEGRQDSNSDEDEHLRLAIQASKEAHDAEAQRTRTEEEIVLDYIKRQSLAEEEHRQAMGGGSDNQKIAVDSDEDLKKAIEASLNPSSSSDA